MQPQVATGFIYLQIFIFSQVYGGVEKTLQAQVAMFVDARMSREKLRDVLGGKGRSEETESRGME